MLTLDPLNVLHLTGGINSRNMSSQYIFFTMSENRTPLYCKGSMIIKCLLLLIGENLV